MDKSNVFYNKNVFNDVQLKGKLCWHPNCQSFLWLFLPYFLKEHKILRLFIDSYTYAQTINMHLAAVIKDILHSMQFRLLNFR